MNTNSNAPFIVTTIRATGVASKNYDLTHFRLVLQDKNKNIAKLKENLSNYQDYFNAELASLIKDDGVIVKENTLKFSPQISQCYRYNVNHDAFPDGFQGRIDVTFTVIGTDKASIIYDKLTSIKNAVVASPTFTVLDNDELYNEALKNAFDKLAVRFNNECGILAKNPANYHICSWEVYYSENEVTIGAARGTRAVTAQSVSAVSPIEIESGVAKISVTVSASFAAK